jgi:hypothetical protein
MTQRVTGALQNLCVASAVITPRTARGDWAVIRKILTIPDDAMLVWGKLHVITAFDDSSTLTIDIGEDVDEDQFTATPIDLKTEAITDLTDCAFVMFGVQGEVRVTFAAAGADAEIGKAVIYMAYVRPDKADGVG